MLLEMISAHVSQQPRRTWLCGKFAANRALSFQRCAQTIAIPLWRKSSPTATPAVKKWKHLELRVRAVDLGIIVDTGFLVPSQTLASASIEKLTRELSMDLPCQDSKTLLKLGVYE